MVGGPPSAAAPGQAEPGVTGLFASPAQPTLRRMCYLTIKEMSCIAEDVIIVTSRRVLGP